MGALYASFSRPIYWEKETELEKEYAVAYIEEKPAYTVTRKGKKVVTDLYILVTELGKITGDEMIQTTVAKTRFVRCDGDTHGYGAALSKLDDFIGNLEADGGYSFRPIF